MPIVGPAPGIQRSAQTFIMSSLRLVGSLRSGQNLTNAELTDSLQVLNDLLDAWSAESTMVFAIPVVSTDQNGKTLTLVGGQQLYTLGNMNRTENFLMNRPPRIERVSILYSASQSTPVEIPMKMDDSVAWQAIANKSTTSILPQECYVEATPDGSDWSLYFWPVPTQANPVIIYPWAALNQFPNLEEQFSFPPAYARAIRYNLAVDLAAEFPCDLQKLPVVIKIAGQAKSVIESLNSRVKEAWCDPALVGAGGPRGNIFTGSPGSSHGF